MDKRYPLSWPNGWPRTAPHRICSPRFETKSIAVVTDELWNEMQRLGASRIILSANLRLRQDGWPVSNQAEPTDRGVAVYFQLAGKEMVLACDRWNKVCHNIWAIVKHIDALRGQQRWGVGSVSQAFAGYTALPERSNMAGPWHEVLGVEVTATVDQIKVAYRERAKVWHPDSGGDQERMAALNVAYEAAMKARNA